MAFQSVFPEVSTTALSSDEEKWGRSPRNRNCYICGNPLSKDATQKYILDKKERRVHTFCLKDYLKAKKDLQKYYYNKE